MLEHYQAAFKKYATFSGRASKKEFWSFVAIMFFPLGSIVLIYLFYYGEDILLPIYILGPIFLLILIHLIPFYAVLVRRLHDTGRSGWWIFIKLIPLIGGLVLFILLLQDSEPRKNEYGPYPKKVDSLNQRRV